MTTDEQSAYEEFARRAGQGLVRAFVPVRGLDDAPDAAAEALAYAWEHWERVGAMDNPMGYLYRVGQSRTRRRRPGLLPAPEAVGMPDVEPALVPALRALPDTQRTAIWLVHACGWTYVETAEAMGVSPSAVGTHVKRAMDRLRAGLEVDSRA
ncbi:MAG TPA: sigma-70 family RNA polymerase sigma factor [Iamia sp.]|nr:sigma-70 family RNA polymerase sigma factor [Iamia sp.]